MAQGKAFLTGSSLVNTKQMISVKEIVLDKDLQSRAGGLKSLHVDDLIFAYEGADKATIEYPRVWKIKGRAGYFLTRGFHRFAALKKLGRKKIDCEVHSGDFVDAVLDAATSNIGHGLKRTAEDKKRCAEMVILAKPDLSDRAIADLIAVSHTLVDEVRAQVEAAATSPSESSGKTRKRVGQDGKTYSVSVPHKKAPVKANCTPPHTTEHEQKTAQLHDELKRIVGELPKPTETDTEVWLGAVRTSAQNLVNHLWSGT
jgi:hypothetical protein